LLFAVSLSAGYLENVTPANNEGNLYNELLNKGLSMNDVKHLGLFFDSLDVVTSFMADPSDI
jgi:hypothetical protein